MSPMATERRPLRSLINSAALARVLKKQQNCCALAATQPSKLYLWYKNDGTS